MRSISSVQKAEVKTELLYFTYQPIEFDPPPPEEWVKRKISALPLAIVGVAMLVAQLTKDLFTGIYAYWTDGGVKEPLKKLSFTFVRNLENVVGDIILVANDRLGVAFIKDACVQKYWYNKVWTENQARKISLFELLNMSESQRNKTIQQFNLDERSSITQLTREGFFQKLGSTDLGLLKSFNLEDVRGDFFPFLCTTQELSEMPLKDAARNFFHLLYSSSQLQKLIRCVEKMPYTLPPTDKISESTTLIDFVHRSGTWIEAHANEIPDEFFGLLSESQVQNIDFSKLSRQQTIFLMEHFPVELLSDEKIKSINPVSFRDWGVKGNLFPFIFWENSPKVREEIKHRVSLLTKEQVDVVAEQRDRVLLLLTDEQVKRFDEKTLGSNSLYEVMPALSKKQRFALLSSKQLNIILNLVLSRLKEASAQKVENVPVKLSWRPDLFPEFVACELKELEGILETVGSVISDEQIKNLNVNNMSKLLFCSLFRTQNLKENQRRFSLLSDQQVNTIVNLGDWGVVDTAGALLTDIQIKNLDIKNLDIHAFRHLFPASGDERRNARRVHQLSTAQVNDLVNKQQPIYQFLYFSDEQIKNLETKNLNKEVVRAIFPGNIRKDLLKHRLSLLFPEKLQSIVDKLDADQLSCLNATQRRSLQVK